jgi:hypothetical protein
MTTAVHSRRRRVSHRPPWIRQHDTEPGAVFALGMMALIATALIVILLAGRSVPVSIPRFLVHVVEPEQPTRPIDGAAPVTSLATAGLPARSINLAAPAQASVGASDPAPAADESVAQTLAAPQTLAVGSRARIANTDGVGVVLYAAPRPSARQPAGLMEGMSVTVLELADSEWARVRADNRQTGWIHAEFLAPAD